MMQYYTEPLVAGQVASGQIGGSGQQVEPGYPAGSTLTLPQLVYNLGFQRFDIGAACVVAVVLFVLSMVFAALLMRRGSVFLGVGEMTDHGEPDAPRPVPTATPTGGAAAASDPAVGGAAHLRGHGRAALRAALRVRLSSPR